MVMQIMAIPEWQGFGVVLKCWMVQSVVDPRVCPCDGRAKDLFPFVGVSHEV